MIVLKRSLWKLGNRYLENVTVKFKDLNFTAALLHIEKFRLEDQNRIFFKVDKN